MFKRILTLAVVLSLFAVVSYAQDNTNTGSGTTTEEGMNFENGSVSDIFALAKAQNKYVFVDCYADWCGPCKWMMANVFPQKEVGEFYNENFVIYKLDMEKGEGVEFAEKYKVHSYPTYLFFNPEGELVHRSGGSKEADMFIQDGKNALNPDMTLFGLQAKYEAGNRSSEVLMNYAYALSNANQKGIKEVADAYFATQSESDLMAENNWNMIYRFTTDINSREFKYLEANSDMFSKTYGEEKVNKKIDNTYISHYFKNRDFKAYGDYVNKIMPAINNSWDALNMHAWNMYEGTDDKELIEMAASWAKRSMEIEENFYNTDTYAALQYKLGNYDEAQKYANIAIQHAKKNNEKYDGTLELIEMIKVKRN